MVARDNNNVFDASFYQFFDDILDNRLIDQWQHLFGHSLGLRQKPRSEARRRNHRFSDWFSVHQTYSTTHQIAYGKYTCNNIILEYNQTAMVTPDAPLHPHEQDERYLQLVPEIEDEFEAGYDETELVYHVWGHALNVYERTSEYREELRDLGVEGVPGQFMTHVDAKGHDFMFKRFFDLERTGDNPYWCPEQLAVAEGGAVLRSKGVDELTIAEYGNHVWGTRFGTRCNTWGRFTLCAADLANTAEGYETVMKSDTEKLRRERSNLTQTEVDPTRFAVSSLAVLSGYHFKNLRFPALLAQSPAIRSMYDRQAANLRTMALETAASVGVVGEEAVNAFLKKLGGHAALLSSFTHRND